MLKACWDCIAGDRTHSESPYGTQLTGDIHRAPPWPRPRDEKQTMLLLPKMLETDDVVVLTGYLEGAKTMTIGLVTGMSEPDNQNVACQLEVNFPSNGDADSINISVIQDGNENLVNSKAATDYFIDGEEFTVKFRVWKQDFLNIYVGPSFLEKVQLVHYVNDIRFLSVNGDVKIKKFEYEFS